MQKSSTYITVEELNFYTRYAEQLKIKDFSAAMVGRESARLDKDLCSPKKAARGKKGLIKK